MNYRFSPSRTKRRPPVIRDMGTDNKADDEKQNALTGAAL